MTSNAQSWNTKYILLSNFGSKHSLVMKFGQFMKYYKMQLLSKKYIKNVSLVCKRHKHHILTSETLWRVLWTSSSLICHFGFNYMQNSCTRTPTPDLQLLYALLRASSFPLLQWKSETWMKILIGWTVSH